MTEIQVMLYLFFGTLIFFFVLMNIWTRGFLLQFMRVKAAREKGQIVMVNSISDVYFRPGNIDGEWLVYKDRNKNNKRLYVKGVQPRRIWSFPVWEVDEEKNAVLNGTLKKGFWKWSKEISVTSPNLLVRTFEPIEGHDAVKTDHLLKRILYAPTIQSKKDMVIIILLCVCIAGILYIAYQQRNFKAALDAISTVASAKPL